MRTEKFYSLPTPTNILPTYNFLAKEQSLLKEFNVNKVKVHNLNRLVLPNLEHLPTITTSPKIVYRQKENLHVKFFRMFIRRGNAEKLFRLFANLDLGFNTQMLSDKSFYTTLKLLAGTTYLVNNSLTALQQMTNPPLQRLPFQNIVNLIARLLRDYLPTFTFHVQKVNKQVQKFSRGKSGKYSLAWAYLPPYRRWSVVLQWLKKDLVFQKNTTLQARINQSFLALLTSPDDTSLARTRRFVHNFVFKKFRKILINLTRYKL